MKAEIPLLQYVRVASPCPASWDAMREVEGDRVKFCEECQKRVYNLSAMGQAEAEGILRRHEGHLCVRYYRRRDGTILTTDCPVGLKAARELAFKRKQVSLALCTLFCAALAAYRAGWMTTDALQTTTGVVAQVDVAPVVVGEMPTPPLPEPTMGTPALPAEPHPLLGEVSVDVKMGEVEPRATPVIGR
jgi:hypothetical protein